MRMWRNPRIAVLLRSATQAEIPASLEQALAGPFTARAIGWDARR